MYFVDSPVKVIGKANLDELHRLHETIKSSFNDKWVRRAINVLMDTSYSIKAITPSTYDIPDKQTQIELKKILLPFVQPYVKDNEMVMYLDLSSLPPGTKSLPHIDWLMFHVIAKRIRIPIVTNPSATIAFKTHKGIEQFNLAVGNVYETNNQVLHAAANCGTSDRWHIVADIIDKDLHSALVNTGKLYEKAFDPMINFLLAPDICAEIEKAIANPNT
jgi:hypothetical protein